MVRPTAVTWWIKPAPGPSGGRGYLRLIALLWAALVMPQCLAARAMSGNAGEAIYRHGVLASGLPLEASRGPDAPVRGAEAACINCHQRSGLGTREGRSLIPPITGRYLVRPRDKSDASINLPYVDGIRNDREPYTDETLARAIRDGIDAGGKPLKYLMPRFDLSDADMAALIGYLKGLDKPRTPGVTDTVLHFATVITPDADPVKSEGMLRVMEQFIADKNAFPVGPTPRVRASRKMMFMANRRWELHVWRLTGPAESWQRQLDRYLAQEPVLAVISGIGGRTWAPVQAFCEQAELPCLFPNVEAPPPDADRHFYSSYFSKGVLLEAELMAASLAEADSAGRLPKVVRQIYRAGDSGEAAARLLSSLLKERGIAVHSEAIPAGAPDGRIPRAVAGAAGADALVLWLRPSDVAALNGAPVPGRVLMSGLLGGLERSPLPADWRANTRLAYPFDLPDRRRVRVDYARGWFSIRHIPVVDERVQADTYLACGLVAETLSHMADTFVRDFLVERIQDTLEHRIVTGYYPRLGLATGQRYASKGGYLVRFAGDAGSEIVAETGWIRP